MGASQSTSRPSGAAYPETQQSTSASNEKQSCKLLKDLSLDDNEALRELTLDTVKKWEKKILADPKNRLAMSAVSNYIMRDVVQQRSALINDAHVFSDQISFDGSPITDQKSSGRCWIFAATSVLRVYLMKKYKLEDFQLSQQYLFFWDKLNKANFFLEQILDTSDEPLDSRIVSELLKGPVGDGGQWDMIVNLVENYGVVPQKLYPDTFNASNSPAVNSLLTSKLREYALQLRELKADARNSEKDISCVKANMMNSIYTIMVICFGPPPKPDEEFTWEFRDKNNKFQSFKTTPLGFYKDFVGYNASEHFSLINDPRHEYGKLYTVDRLGNVFGGKPIRYINVDMPTMKKAIIAMIKKDHPVFFGSDVGKYMNATAGVLDPALFDYSLAFNVTLGMSKAQRLMVGESAMTHAMTLNGVHIVDGKSTKWKIQNSWGETTGEKGWYMATDAWMDEFCYQAVTSAEFVGKEIADILKTKPIVLPLWDPMGALA